MPAQRKHFDLILELLHPLERAAIEPFDGKAARVFFQRGQAARAHAEDGAEAALTDDLFLVEVPSTFGQLGGRELGQRRARAQRDRGLVCPAGVRKGADRRGQRSGRWLATPKALGHEGTAHEVLGQREPIVAVAVDQSPDMVEVLVAHSRLTGLVEALFIEERLAPRPRVCRLEALRVDLNRARIERHWPTGLVSIFRPHHQLGEIIRTGSGGGVVDNLRLELHDHRLLLRRALHLLLDAGEHRRARHALHQLARDADDLAVDLDAQPPRLRAFFHMGDDDETVAIAEDEPQRAATEGKRAQTRWSLHRARPRARVEAQVLLACTLHIASREL